MTGNLNAAEYKVQGKLTFLLTALPGHPILASARVGKWDSA